METVGGKPQISIIALLAGLKSRRKCANFGYNIDIGGRWGNTVLAQESFKIQTAGITCWIKTYCGAEKKLAFSFC